MRRKITVVGAGQTGATLAHWLAQRGDVDVVLFDIVEGMPQGKALDLLQAMPIIGSDAQIPAPTAIKIPLAQTSSLSPVAFLASRE